MPAATLLTHLKNKARLWQSNGSTKISVVVNLFCLALAWALVPLESKAGAAYRTSFNKLYPQIDPNAPKALDCVRWLIQTLYLICFKSAGPSGWLCNLFGWTCRKITEAFTKLGNWIAYYGARALDGNHKSLETIDKTGETMSRPV